VDQVVVLELLVLVAQVVQEEHQIGRQSLLEALVTVQIAALLLNLQETRVFGMVKSTLLKAM
jgi:hypothetical protein